LCAFLVDDKTKEEFQSWMQRFPHLRIIGTRINLPLRNQQRFESLSNYEEIFAIDPPVFLEPFKMLDQELNEKLSLRKARQPSASQLKVDDLEKLLRITSSSGLSRNHQQQQIPLKKVVDRTSTYLVKQNSVGLHNIKKLSRIQEHKKFELSPVTIIPRELDKHSYSATTATSPYVKSIKSAQLNKLYVDISNERQKIPKNEFSSKSASIHHHKKMNPNNPNLQLPPFNYEFIQVRGYSNHNKH
jgi:hypothetical protein